MAAIGHEQDPASSTDKAAERVFYRPDKSIYKPRTKPVNEDNITAITAEWSVSASNGEIGSILDNGFAWQKKWYLRFVPPKSAEELQIGQHWRYDGPRLESFIAEGQEKLPSQEELTPTALSGLKSMAVKLLSGITQETLAKNSYLIACEGHGSVAGRDKEGSTVSSQLRMPESQGGGTKRSILAAYTIEKNKATKKSKK
ncbi:AMP-dependent synthetase ligase, putative [Babesia ovis]|uniref:AMP-dependent synthetase ligase, putative n=1 Tax=Babesia ovis TaxID=5869 RepID=A0A9W5TBY0_BABOV|nr:AMP-dependent synthetase ligase, putative [Babesia ovis]